MKAKIGVSALLLAVCLALPLVAKEGERERPEKPDRPQPAQDWEQRKEMTPEERERMREEMREKARERERMHDEMREKARERERMRDEMREKAGERERMRDEVGREKPEERGGGFILGFLHQQPEYREAVKKHHENMSDIREKLAEVREGAAQKMREARTPEARQAIIAETRTETADLFKQIVDEAVRHHEEIAELTRANRDKIIEQALEHIYDGQRRQEERPVRKKQD